METNNERREEDRQQILAHLDSIFKAFVSRDPEVLKQTHMADFKGFTVRSRTVILDREQYLQDIWRVLENYRIHSYEFLEQDLTFWGDTAVACYIALVHGTSRHGREFENKMRIMDIYTKTAAGWNLCASSVSLHPDEIDQLLSAAVTASSGS